MIKSFTQIFFPLPQLASREGAQVDLLLYLTHVLILILFIGWAAFFIYVVFRFRKKRHPRASYHGAKSKWSTSIELAVAAVEGLLLVGISIPFWARHINQIAEGQNVIRVRVVAQQFAWNFHYPGRDGLFGKTSEKYFDPQTNPLGLDPNDTKGRDDFITINRMDLPVDRTAVLTVSSKDVIHSLSIPAMRVKQDAIPGMDVPVQFTPVKKGTFDIACAQLCGLGHYRMRGFLTVTSREKYENWVNSNEP